MVRKRAWWTADASDLPGVVQQTVQSLADALSEQREDTLHHLRLYSNFNVSGVSDLTSGYYGYAGGRLRFNLCASIADTATARVFTSKPTVEYVTEGADWTTRRKAVKRSEALQGQMYDLGGYRLAKRAGKDAVTTGQGCVIGFLDAAGNPGLRRVWPNQLLVDPTETLDGQATCIYLAYPADRATLIAAHPELEQQLLESGKDKRSTEYLPQTLGYDSQVDQVTIYEAFRIATLGPDGELKPGRHVIATDKCVLVAEDFDQQEFDIAVLRWVERPFGFFGQGIVERTKDAQWRINKLIRRTERIQDLASNAVIFTRDGNGITPDDLHNSAVPVYTFTGEPPRFERFEATPVDLTNEIGLIREQTLAQEGLNEQSTQGTVPAGVESGAAIRALDGQQDTRLSDYQQNWEDFHVEMFRLIERLNDRAAAKNPSFTVLGRGSKGSRMTTKSYRWKDLELPTDDVRMRAAPMSSLPTTVAGKIDAVREWISLGFVTRNQAMDLMQIPDLDSAIADQLAHYELAQTQVEWMLDGEQNILPIAYQDMQVAAEVASLALVKLETMKAPDDIKAQVEQYFLATMPPEQAGAAADASVAAPGAVPSPAGPPVVDPSMAPAAPSDMPAVGALDPNLVMAA